jgi:hypothetical protein
VGGWMDTHPASGCPGAVPPPRAQAGVDDALRIRARAFLLYLFDIRHAEALRLDAARPVGLQEDVRAFHQVAEFLAVGGGGEVELRGTFPEGGLRVQQGKRREVGRGYQEDLRAVCWYPNSPK